MLLAQVGLGGAGMAAAYGIPAMFASLFSMAGLFFGLTAFALSFAWRSLPRFEEKFAAGAVVCFVCYAVIWIVWGRVPTTSPVLLAAFVGPVVGVVSAWRSHRRRSALSKR